MDNGDPLSPMLECIFKSITRDPHAFDTGIYTL